MSSKYKQVPHVTCIVTGKRSFADEHDAAKALGRAQFKRRQSGTRGVRTETRFYYCNGCQGYHLTAESRRTFNGAQLRLVTA